MKDVALTVLDRQEIADKVFCLVLRGDCSEIRRPGQFVHLEIPERFLRRPISICDWEKDRLILLFKAVGYGTSFLGGLSPGERLKGLLPLGNGFDIEKAPEKPLLIGGGLGVPPLYGLCKRLLSAGKHPLVLLGFNTEAEIFRFTRSGRGDSAAFPAWPDAGSAAGNPCSPGTFSILDAFRELGVPAYLATEDGSEGIKGMVTDLLDLPELGEYALTGKDLPVENAGVWQGGKSGFGTEGRSGIRMQGGQESCLPREDIPKMAGYYAFCCGPLPMLEAVYRRVAGGQFSLESRMGCGFGACMGCSMETRDGVKRICKEGPVFLREELPWEN